MRIAIGADHGGFKLKDELAAYLRSRGHEILDLGTSSDEAVDYPVYAHAVAREVAAGRCERGIAVDGAGMGSAMAANKVRGVRAAMAYDVASARNSGEHNDANVLTLGAGRLEPSLARRVVETWLASPCTAERHRRRVALIGKIERGERIPGPPGLASPSPGHGGSLPEITDEDLERIAKRLEALLGPGREGEAAGAGRAGHGGGAGASGGAGPAWAGSWAAPAPPGPSIASAPETARRFLDLGARRLSTGPSPGPIPDDIASYIDHTLLKPDAVEEEIRQICAEAREHGFAAACVNPFWIPLVARELRGSGVLPCSVVGFPLGSTHPETKALEARRAIREGAREIDMVINVGALKGRDDEHVLKDIRAVVEACRDGSARCKVILETALLSDDEKRRACRLAHRARADFVKTSTGFGPGGATVEDVALMAGEVRPAGMGVKASGGIRTYEAARNMIEAGATRIGASASVNIVKEAPRAAAA